MKWKTSVFTVTQALQVIRGYLIAGDERIVIEAKEKRSLRNHYNARRPRRLG